MEWKLGRSHEACLGCQKTFQQGDIYFSVIDLDEEDPRREDFCPKCFREGSENRVFWKTRKAEQVERKKVVDFNRLREIFVKMVAHEGARHRELAYLIGLLLIRKRLLKLKEFTTEDGQDLLVMTQPKTDRIFRVEAPLLTPDQVTSLRDKLSALVDGDLDWGEDEVKKSDSSAGGEALEALEIPITEETTGTEELPRAEETPESTGDRGDTGAGAIHAGASEPDGEVRDRSLDVDPSDEVDATEPFVAAEDGESGENG